MKLSYQIFIILFVVSSLFIVKDDLKPVYNRSITYLESVFNKGSTVTNTNKDDSKIDVGKTDPIVSPASEATPGPLKIISDVFTTTPKTPLSVKAVIALTNKNRAANGNLSPLKENSKLDASAEIKLKDMFTKQYFEHVSPTGVGIKDLGKEVGYEYFIIGENLALGNFTNDTELVDGWMASPGHRANILNTHYTEIGVAVGQGIYQGQTVWLAVQHFGLPQSACPPADKVLDAKITLNKEQSKKMESDLLTRRSRIDSGVVYDGKTTNEQIREYNDLVAIYNQLLITIKEEVDTYNTGIISINSCIKNSTQINN